MTLLDFLKKDKARLIFGKSEIEIIRKQLNGLELKPSEKVRLSRDIRKKFEAIEEISKYKQEFKLKKSQEIKYLITDAKETILNELGNKVSEIILFGSYAIKKPTKISDIDIAIKMTDQINHLDKKLNKQKIDNTKLRAKLLGKMSSEKIDIQIYEELPKKMKNEIDKTGKIIFQND